MPAQIITACALVHRTRPDGQPEIFLARRATTKSFMPDVFEILGGHIEFGEPITTGLQREFQEEIGLDITLGDPFAVFDYTGQALQTHTIEVIYFAQFTQPDPVITLNPKDHSEYRWVSLAELPRLYSPTKPENDQEFTAARRGLELLSAKQLNFG